MNYNGKEIEVTCTLENDTPKITIIDDNLKFPFTNINKAAEFLVTEYGGIKEEAVLALKNLLQDTDVSQDTVQTETKTKESNHQDLINNIESGNFNGITANELLKYFRHVYKSKYNEEYGIDYDRDKKILEDNIKRFGVEETVCRIDKLIHNYNAINGGNSRFPRPYVRQLDIHAKNPWISDKLQGMERVVKNTSFNNEKGREDRCIEISTKDFFSMSMEEFDTYVRNEFLKKGIDINDLSLPPEEVKERYKDEIKALEEAEAKLLKEKDRY
jgi:hypothetical protein